MLSIHKAVLKLLQKIVDIIKDHRKFLLQMQTAQAVSGRGSDNRGLGTPCSFDCGGRSSNALTDDVVGMGRRVTLCLVVLSDNQFGKAQSGDNEQRRDQPMATGHGLLCKSWEALG